MRLAHRAPDEPYTSPSRRSALKACACHPGLWRAAEDLLSEPVRYEATSRAGYYRARDYRPAQIADLLVKVVS